MSRKFPLRNKREVRDKCHRVMGLIALDGDPVLWHPDELREAGFQFVDMLVSELDETILPHMNIDAPMPRVRPPKPLSQPTEIPPGPTCRRD